MLTIDLEPELETLLNKMAQQAHCSPNEIIKQLISHYLEQQQASELLTNIIKHEKTFLFLNIANIISIVYIGFY